MAHVHVVVCALVLGLVSAQQRAICVLTPTLANADEDLTGVFHFTQPSNDTEASIEVSYTLYGLSNGRHQISVHDLGTMHSTDGSATGAIFQGDCANNNRCRPNNAQQATGALNNGGTIRSTDGVANGTFTDVAVHLVGVNSIIGRSVVVFGNANDADARVAQCTVSRNNDESEVTDQQVSNTDGVTIADCMITPTSDGEGTESGHAWFESLADGTLGVSLYVAGLAEDGIHPFHVHDRGNIDTSSASPQGNHFVGNYTGNSGERSEVGQLGGDNSINVGVGARQGIASVSFADTHAKLNGDNSIVGRSLVIHRPSDGARVAHCVIGIQREEPPQCEYFDCQSRGSTPRVMRAMAVMTPASGYSVTGTVELTESLEGDTVDLRYFFTGLAPGNHRWHIHVYGDTYGEDGRSTGNHFQGTCDECRTFPNPFEVGYIGDGEFVVAMNDTQALAYGTITDTELKLNGENSVIGRSIIVHGDGVDPAIRVSQGIIGRIEESLNETASEPPVIFEGVCRFEPTHNDDSLDVAGHVTFLRSTGSMQATFNISGLTPGEHAWHVHEWGHMVGAHDAMSTGGHFVGEGIDRPGEALNEVGNINDGIALSVDGDGEAVGSFRDRHLDFSGMNTIIGRSVVIHEVGGSAREAMCVVGISKTSDDFRIRFTGGGEIHARVPSSLLIVAYILAAGLALL